MASTILLLITVALVLVLNAVVLGYRIGLGKNFWVKQNFNLQFLIALFSITFFLRNKLVSLCYTDKCVSFFNRSLSLDSMILGLFVMAKNEQVDQALFNSSNNCFSCMAFQPPQIQTWETQWLSIAAQYFEKAKQHKREIIHDWKLNSYKFEVSRDTRYNTFTRASIAKKLPAPATSFLPSYLAPPNDQKGYLNIFIFAPSFDTAVCCSDQNTQVTEFTY